MGCSLCHFSEFCMGDKLKRATDKPCTLWDRETISITWKDQATVAQCFLANKDTVRTATSPALSLRFDEFI